MKQDIDEILELLSKNEAQSALHKCTDLVNQSPTSAEILHLQGIIHAKMGNLRSALQAFSQAIKLNPNEAIYHNNISNVYKLLGNLELASRHLHQALVLAPNNAESYNNLASLYYTQGQIKLALPLYEKAIRLNPNSWEAHYNLANCNIKCEQVSQAISHYETAIKLNPKHADAKLNLAMAYVSIHDYSSALPYLIEAATNNPAHAELQGHLAEAYVDLGKPLEAIAQFNKALALEPDRAEWHHNIAVLYIREKEQQLAKLHFERTLELQPENKSASYLLSCINTETVSNAPPEYVSELFDQYASYYNQHMTKALNYKVPQLLRQAVSKYINAATKTQNVLDLGCGTGICGIYFRDLAEFLIGIDLSEHMLAHAKVLGAYDGLCRGNILEVIPGCNRQVFDIILAADVLVYIGELEGLFSMISGALRKNNGKFVFTVEELNGANDYELQNTGRFAHNDSYIKKVCANFNLNIDINDRVILREQQGAPIYGRLYVAILAE
jgi:predicted TPR repeat methyltransferase